MAERAPDAAAGAAAPAKVMTSPPTVQKRSQPNGHASPVHLIANPDSPAAKQNEALTPPFVTEKRPQANGHASPIRLPVNSNGHAGKQHVEGYLKTDDRMRLAKERREEREKSLVAREQAIREKERRARLQYEKTVEERWRRLEEQRQKEDQRRAAVEEKRRQQLEEEKERLEAMMRKSMERSLQLEQRQKRWMWGGAQVPPSPHRSPYRGSPRRRPNPPPYDETSGGDLMCPNTPKKERLRRDRRTGSPATGSPVRRAESPANLARRSASPATPKMMPKSRNQSPCPVRTYPSSPMRQRTPVSEATRKNEDKEVQEKESSPVTSAGKTVAGTTDAEEASRLLAERRRLARVQKELEENQRREQEEQERVKAEQLKKRQAEERIRQEQETRQINEEKKRREQAEKRQEEEQERQLQAQLDREVRGHKMEAYFRIFQHKHNDMALRCPKCFLIEHFLLLQTTAMCVTAGGGRGALQEECRATASGERAAAAAGRAGATAEEKGFNILSKVSSTDSIILCFTHLETYFFSPEDRRNPEENS
uniref:Uncharacterized protein n=1 Tax=Denticeps clupeoides TaxID=299321 RepID=A0AAY4DRM1_9TELE